MDAAVQPGRRRFADWEDWEWPFYALFVGGPVLLMGLWLYAPSERHVDARPHVRQQPWPVAASVTRRSVHAMRARSSLNDWARPYAQARLEQRMALAQQLDVPLWFVYANRDLIERPDSEAAAKARAAAARLRAVRGHRHHSSSSAEPAVTGPVAEAVTESDAEAVA